MAMIKHIALCCLAVALVGAGSATNEVPPILESPAARARIEQLRARFVMPAALRPSAFPQAAQAPALPRPALGPDVAIGFELSNGHLRPAIPADAKQRVKRTATVALPTRAGDPVQLEDDTSHMAVSFTLRGASQVAATPVGGLVLYSGALAGADVLHRAHAEGTEDYVVFEERPAKEEIAYDVDVSRVSGLRLMSNTLEFLDAAGAPRLRVGSPYLLDGKGAPAEGVLAVEGCVFDTSPRGPWGRAVTPPGASRCLVRVAWKAVTYPAMLDPNWAATGSMATARQIHTATLLGSGSSAKALVVGGFSAHSNAALLSAELYDPTAGTFAATGAMTTARWFHTATLLGSGDVLIAGGAIGLNTNGNGFIPTSSAELYDQASGTFSSTGSMTVARVTHTATLLGSGEILVVGGCTGQTACGNPNSDPLSSAELYNPTAASFSTINAPLTAQRFYHTATLLNSGDVLIAGGYYRSGSTFIAVSSAEVYSPAAGTFTATNGSMTTARASYTATRLGSGQVLVAGGCGGWNSGVTECNIFLSSAELYDPMTGTFTATNPMSTARWFHTGTLLGSGEVLVAGGGIDGTYDPTSAAEFYDPDGGAFAPTVSLTSARTLHTSTLLGSGDVLVAGGYSGHVSNASVANAEIFSCTTECPAGSNCGTINLCDGTVLSCGGACTAPQTCGGGGTLNVCGCTPISECPGGSACMTLPDGCGGTFTCGLCGGGGDAGSSTSHSSGCGCGTSKSDGTGDGAVLLVAGLFIAIAGRKLARGAPRP
jgi:hypothetical protein